MNIKRLPKRIKCLIGLHEKSDIFVRLRRIKRRKRLVDTYEEYCVCKNCGKTLGKTGRKGTKQQLFE